jgi:hypothetical protein
MQARSTHEHMTFPCFAARSAKDLDQMIPRILA